jgi:hypothetical protein
VPKLEALDFPNTLFGVSREELTMDTLTSIYVDLFGEPVTTAPSTDR